MWRRDVVVFLGGGGASGHGKLANPAHHKAQGHFCWPVPKHGDNDENHNTMAQASDGFLVAFRAILPQLGSSITGYFGALRFVDQW